MIALDKTLSWNLAVRHINPVWLRNGSSDIRGGVVKIYLMTYQQEKKSSATVQYYYYYHYKSPLATRNHPITNQCVLLHYTAITGKSCVWYRRIHNLLALNYRKQNTIHKTTTVWEYYYFMNKQEIVQEHIHSFLLTVLYRLI